MFQIIFKVLYYFFLVFSFNITFAEDDRKQSKIIIEKVYLIEEQQKFSLSGDVSVTLEETLINALVKGVTLEFISELELLSARRVFPDRIVKQWKRKASLTYHGITRRYYVKIREKKIFFESLTLALAACLGLKKWIKLKKKYVQKKNSMRVKLSLNIDSLPKPLALVAASDPAWKMTTGWVLVSVEE